MRIVEQRNEDLAKWARIIEKLNVGMLVTQADNGTLRGRPLTPIEIDATPSVWFLVSKTSELVADVKDCRQVCLTFAHPTGDYSTVFRHGYYVNRSPAPRGAVEPCRADLLSGRPGRSGSVRPSPLRCTRPSTGIRRTASCAVRSPSRAPSLPATRRRWASTIRLPCSAGALFRHRGHEVVEELTRTALPRVRLGERATVRAAERQCALDGRFQIHVQRAGHAIAHHVQRTGDGEGGHGYATGHRLQHHETEGVRAARKYEHVPPRRCAPRAPHRNESR